MKFKVPIFGSVGKFAWLDEKATVGAQIGLNLLMPDGSLATTTTLQALFAPSPSGTGELTTTDDLDEGQWNLYFTPRRAQDAVGAILADSANVSLTYVGGTSITADLTDVGNTGEGEVLALSVDAKGRVIGRRAAAYEHTQTTPAAVWTINHNLGFKPAVSLRTAGDAVFDAQVDHLSANTARVTLSQPLAGSARCH